jgi:hypothetical protein
MTFQDLAIRSRDVSYMDPYSKPMDVFECLSMRQSQALHSFDVEESKSRHSQVSAELLRTSDNSASDFQPKARSFSSPLLLELITFTIYLPEFGKNLEMSKSALPHQPKELVKLTCSH